MIFCSQSFCDFKVNLFLYREKNVFDSFVSVVYTFVDVFKASFIHIFAIYISRVLKIIMDKSQFVKEIQRILFLSLSKILCSRQIFEWQLNVLKYTGKNHISIIVQVLHSLQKFAAFQFIMNERLCDIPFF